MLDHVCILAGGSGTRLWPASNSTRPKQFLPLQEGKSLLRLTIERALGLGMNGDVLIITLAEQMEEIVKECAALDEESAKRVKVIPEPAARNTAPAIAVAAEYIRSYAAEGREATTAVLTADHLIRPLEAFREDMEKADALAREGFLVTFGIPPTRPETGYGYIESGEELDHGYRVRSFREKPNAETARTFLEQGNYYWNSGMFAFRVGLYLDELRRHRPDIGELFVGLGEKGGRRKEQLTEILMEGAEVEKVYQRSPKESIDYAVMEHSDRVAMVAATFEWNDIGSWEEMCDLYAEAGSTDSEANVPTDTPEFVGVDSRENFVYSDIPVALCGVDDLMVVQKNGVLLIAKKGSGQKVKQVVNELKSRGREELL
ncbi:MAG TPA: mannose-1-phosphate guanylyltransferase [Sediminispirochaeta sp.]|nr:mannose-1-phosphate guanylyltransferase [Sediminispirochaeta sp.]